MFWVAPRKLILKEFSTKLSESLADFEDHVTLGLSKGCDLCI